LAKTVLKNVLLYRVFLKKNGMPRGDARGGIWFFWGRNLKKHKFYFRQVDTKKFKNQVLIIEYILLETR
jgi:hypothetical protein